MSYQLVLTEPSQQNIKEVGENVLFDNLPSDCKVYTLYYPGSTLDDELENKLRLLGSIAGKNLFVNIGRLNDPNFDLIVHRFDIRLLPVIVVTGIHALASNTNKSLTAFVRIDSKGVFKSPELVVESVQTLFNLFIQGKISEAIKQAEQTRRDAVIMSLKAAIFNSLKGMKNYLSDKDVSISTGPFSLNIKRSVQN